MPMLVIKDTIDGFMGRVNEMLRVNARGGGIIYEGSYDRENKPRVMKITIPDTPNITAGNTIPEPLDIEPSRSILDLAPFFSWGTPGPGSRQLSIALIFDATNDKELARKYYPEFMSRFVRGWGDGWSINSTHIRDFIALKERLARQRDV